MDISHVQKNILDTYFAKLQRYGYVGSKELKQVVFSVLLLDAVSIFRNYLTSSFKKDIDRIMRRLDCCNCAVSWSELIVSNPFYIIGEVAWEMPPHTHIINEIIGLQAHLDELDLKIKQVDSKANAGL